MFDVLMPATMRALLLMVLMFDVLMPATMRTLCATAQTSKQCMRARIAASDIIRLSPVVEEDLKEKGKYIL